MNVTLPPELERYVESKVKCGLYQSESEVIREGLRLMWERDQTRIEGLLLESENSEESPLTQEDWKELRNRVKSARG